MKLPTLRWLDRSVVFGLCTTLCTSEAMFNRVFRSMCKGVAPEWCRPGKACVHTVDSPGQNPALYVCIDAHHKDVFGKPMLAAAMLAHEAVHVKQRLMETIGEDKPSDEFEAYVIQNVVHGLLEEYHRQVFRSPT